MRSWRGILLILQTLISVQAFAWVDVSEWDYAPVIDRAKAYAAKGTVTKGDVHALVEIMKTWTDDGSAPPDLQALIYEVEAIIAPVLDRRGKVEFQLAVGRFGGHLRLIDVPPKLTASMWLEEPSSLKYFQSNGTVPAEVDVLIVGAGLTGASAAYHLSDQAARNELTVAVVDLGGVGEGASGHNGGNFELMQESFIQSYEDLVTERYKFLRAYYLATGEETLRAVAREQARLLMQIGIENSRIFKDMIARERIEADVSSSGWLRIANSTKDEQTLLRDMIAAQEFGVQMEMLNPAQIRGQFGMVSEFGGRIAHGFGNYHPKKFTDETFKVALRKNVELYTQTRVLKIDQSTAKDQPVVVHTNRGPIRARKVIMATDAYTPKLLPEMKGIILPYKSIVLTFEHMVNYLGGVTGTERDGDLYFNGPKVSFYTDEFGTPRMTLLIGGGPDELVNDAEHIRLSKKTYETLRAWVAHRFPWTVGQPPSRAWTKAFGFTPDRMLIADQLADPRIISFIGTQGYGGSMCMLGGKFAALLAAGDLREAGKIRKVYFPEKHVSSKRFCQDWLTGI